LLFRFIANADHDMRNARRYVAASQTAITVAVEYHQQSLSNHRTAMNNRNNNNTNNNRNNNQH